MKNLYRFMQITLLFIFMVGCAKKEMYKFAHPLGSFDKPNRVSEKEIYSVKHIRAENLNKIKAPPPVEEISYSAGLHPNLPLKLNPSAALPEKNVYSENNPVKPPSFVKNQSPKISKPFQKPSKIYADTREGKPIHKLANLGVILGIVGWISALIALLSGGAILLLLLASGSFISGFFTSKKGLSEIKKAPEQYRGKGTAKAGMILSGFVIVALVAFILYILAFAGAFS
jgi:hypothetical protein